MTLKRISGAVAPTLLAALAAAGSGVPAAHAEAVKLKAASFLPQRVIVAKHFYEWAEKVNEECAGEVEISVVGPASSRTRPQIESSRLRLQPGKETLAIPPFCNSIGEKNGPIFRGLAPQGARSGDSTLIGDGLVMAPMAATINRERPGTGFGEERSQ